MNRTLGTIEIEDIMALVELAARAPKSQAEQRWLTQFAARLSQAQEATNGQQAPVEEVAAL